MSIITASSICEEIKNRLSKNGDGALYSKIILDFNGFEFTQNEEQSNTTITKKQAVEMISVFTKNQMAKITNGNSEEIYSFLEPTQIKIGNRIMSRIIYPQEVLSIINNNYELFLSNEQILEIIKCLNQHQLNLIHEKLKDEDFLWY